MYKRCTECGEVKPLEDFYRHPKMRDGHLNQCKECKLAKGRAWMKANPKRAQAASKRWQERNPEKTREWKRRKKQRYEQRHRDKYLARKVFAQAVASGRLVRPEICSRCRESGREIHGHHDDYSKPLSVRWLCRECHQAIHRKAAHV